jgi:hypothetical protein
MAHSGSHGPAYYRRGRIQTWDFIRDQGLNFHLGNAIKYICRAGFKDSKVDDLKKAIHYLQNELENEITFQRTSKGVPQSIQSVQQQDTIFTDYATDFDR